MELEVDVERDACGIGFVADSSGRASRAIVDLTLEALRRVRHRGALAADELTGDGAGVLLPLPVDILRAELGHLDPGGRLGLAMTFLDPSDPAPGRAAIENACAAAGIKVLTWRRVPTTETALGERARRTSPLIEQAVLADPGGEPDALETTAWKARRAAERIARTENVKLYIASLSFHSVTYKALCAADQLANYYGDLADERFAAWFGIFHQRYSTNTAPTWERAQPFRFLAHNGEINTIRGNAAAMRAREGRLGASHGLEDLLRPIVDPAGSDSQMLDEALEILTRGGRSMAHAAAMLVPPAWEESASMDPSVKAFLEYHSCLMEPWDGPAAMVFSDGYRVGAALDRNGLRPLRAAVCEDGLVACASEVGAVPIAGRGSVRRLKLGPGGSLVVDPRGGGLMLDEQVKASLARTGPYARWVRDGLDRRARGTALAETRPDLPARQVAAGFSKEEITVVVRPMGAEGAEPTSSMGDDTAQPPLAPHGRTVFGFLKQRFAQVTNPPIDHLRERHVMSLTTRLGARGSLLRPDAAAARLIEYRSFVLFPSDVTALEAGGAVVLDSTFDVAEGPDGLEPALRSLTREACDAVRGGAGVVIVSDRFVGAERVAIPIALAAGAVHHGLVRAGLRPLAGLVVDSDEPRETHHAACLLTNGVDAICPRLALETLADLAARGRLGGGVESSTAQENFASALEDGLLKVMSKMGISTLDSYRGAQIIEAIGLGPDVVDLCFEGLYSPIAGLSLLELGGDALARHSAAFDAKPTLVATGFIKHKTGGEYHAINPEVVDSLHRSVGIKEVEADDMTAAHALRRSVRGHPAAYEEFAALVNNRPPTEPRDLLDPVPDGPAVAVADVEAAEDVARRFSTGAMSHGALSAEAHETLSLALNMIGGKANTGEGGEAPERYRDARNSGIKQIASGRFGVTPDYVAFADELQIKMAQGSKPGEGGQLPGKKVTVEIARLRHTVPGVALISPPPHHDIYSIEDLAQLIYDLKQANPRAAVSVKLVASEDVGTIAAGVVKGLADVVHIAGGDGGTGASPLSSIKNAGLPWEIGLVDAQRTLSYNGLRGRVRLRIDGGIKTGRDIVLAALLGADEFSFGTAALVAEGCILVRTCHRNTCPVGIATQDPALRAKFAGTPEMVAHYLMSVAEETRSLLASLGLRSLGEAVGRADLLRPKEQLEARPASLDLRALMAPVAGERRYAHSLELQRPRSELGDRVYDDVMPALTAGRSIRVSYPISNGDRSVGARLGCAIGYELGAKKHSGSARVDFYGEAGQSFGAFLSEGVDFALHGEANDYVGKGMGGGRLVIRPPDDDAGDPVLVGNTVLYGATGGSIFIAGRAGERFAVRNSGAVAVVEGVGDHALEYMTAGAVVILGRTGINVGAGMSGGEAYVWDEAGDVEHRLNHQLVAAYEPTVGQLESLRRVVHKHLDLTRSARAAAILADWEASSKLFRRVAPKAEVARLEALFEGTSAAAAA